MIFIALISFSYINKLATATRTVLNNGDDNGQPYVVFNCNGIFSIDSVIAFGVGQI